MSEERHMTNMGWSDRYYLHTSIGYQYQQGLAASGYTLNTQTDAAVTFGLTDGVMLDEDITVSIKHAAVPTNRFEQYLTDPAQIPVYYRSGAAGVWNRDAPTNYWVKNTVGGTARVNYNQFVAGAWQQTEVATTNYVAYWIFATNSVLNPIISVQGQREDSSLVNARSNNTLVGLSLGTPPFAEMKLLYRFIARTGTAYGGTRKFEISDVVDYRPATTSTLIVPGMPAALINLDVTNFTYNFSSTDTTVQAALQTTNDHNHGLKAGTVQKASFGGPSDKMASVLFTTPYADATYAITLSIYTDGSANAAYIATVENKLAGGFDIRLHTGNIDHVIEVGWITKTVGE